MNFADVHQEYYYIQKIFINWKKSTEESSNVVSLLNEMFGGLSKPAWAYAEFIAEQVYNETNTCVVLCDGLNTHILPEKEHRQ